MSNTISAEGLNNYLENKKTEWHTYASLNPTNTTSKKIQFDLTGLFRVIVNGKVIMLTSNIQSAVYTYNISL